MSWRKWFGVGSAVLALGACGGDAATGTGDTGGQIGQDATASDTAGQADVPAAGPAVVVHPLTTIVTVLGQQAKLSGVLLQPETCTASSKCPLVVVVGDYDSNAYDAYVDPAKKLAAAIPADVVVFNLPGTGPGSKKSAGVDDFGGEWHRTAVKEIVHLVGGGRPEVDKARIGFITIGTGLIPVSGALKKLSTSSAMLKNVAFLIDVEGPTDRCAISQAPLDEANGIGPGDGEGATTSSCHYSTKAPQSAVYPQAPDGKPASIVCALGAWPISVTGESCSSTWWTEREPLTYLSALTQRYQRLQFTHDHRLPSYWSSRLAVQKVAGSPSRYFALNNMPPCEALPTDEECVGQPCWLEGDYGNGLPPAPYAAGKLKPVSVDSLFTQVLPAYVLRMLDDVTYPNCR